MLNRRERELLQRVYQSLNAMAGLGPVNPADIKRFVQVRHVAVPASRALAMAVSSLGFQDYDVAEEYIADAEAIIKADRERGQ